MGNTFDVIVVGAGYIGSSAAYHMCAAGLRTALFDLGSMAAGASGQLWERSNPGFGVK